MVQSQDIDALKKGAIPEKTNRATDWAVCTLNFHTWCRHRKEQLPDNICSDEILQLLSDENSSLCHWLCVVCNEGRRKDGIQCYIHNHKPITILDSKDPAFQPLHHTLYTYLISCTGCTRSWDNMSSGSNTITGI